MPLNEPQIVRARQLARQTIALAAAQDQPHPGQHPARPVAAFILQYLTGRPGLAWQSHPQLAHPFFKGLPIPAGLSVIGSLEEAGPTAEGADPSLWYHVSFARKNSTPEYRDIKAVRETMFRCTSTALQIFPAVSQHVNIHEHTLHLWECLAGWENPPDLRQHCPILGGLGI